MRRARLWLVAMTGLAGVATAVATVVMPSGGQSASLRQTSAVAQAATVHYFTATADLNGRAGKSLNAKTVKVNEYRKGQKVPVVCQDAGEYAYGSAIWDKTSAGTWVTDVYVKTGYSGYDPHVARCGSSSTGSVKKFKAETDLNGRTGKTLSATTKKVYKNGALVSVKCQAYGAYAYGSYIWDKTTDNLWVTDKYLKTGYSGFVPGLSRCDNDQPSGGTTGGTGSGSKNCYASTAVHGRNTGTKGATTGTVAQRRARIVAAAISQTGKGFSYSWGAGGKGGAACGISSPSPGGYVDYRRYGYDCSGLSLYAVWKGAGIDIGPSTYYQYSSSRGKKVTWANRQPGDLIFWGNGSGAGNTDHVAVYIGNGKMVEAAPPRGTASVHVTTPYSTSRMMPYLVRFVY